jgi:hypothetical protein
MERANLKSRPFNSSTIGLAPSEITTVEILKQLLLSAGFATAIAGSAWGTEPPVSAAQDVGAAVDSESAAQAAWRTFMARNPMPVGGCFHASYPSTVWKRVDCKTTRPRVHPTHVRPTGAEAKVTDDGHE